MHQREAIKRTIDRAIKLRVSVTQSACNACERKPTCPYLQQWREDGPGLVIVPQAYFRLGVIPGVTGAAEAANDKVPPAPVEEPPAPVTELLVKVRDQISLQGIGFSVEGLQAPSEEGGCGTGCGCH